MNTKTTIPNADDAWESGQLGNDEKYVEPLSADELAADAVLIQESLGLQPISIRLERSLIETFKVIASIEGLGYQTLMRQALKRFANCEMKRILQEVASEKQAQAKSAEDKAMKRKAPKVA